MNFLYHVPELDELDGPPSYLALLEEECWSDIFAPEYEEDFFPMDRQRIIRLRILGYWHGLRFPEDRSQPEFFHFDRSLLSKYAIVFVYPFCEAGYARVLVMEKRTRKLSYALCKTDGSLIIKKLFQYIAKPGTYAKDPSAALVFADDWTAAIVRTDGSASLLPGQ